MHRPLVGRQNTSQQKSWSTSTLVATVVVGFLVGFVVNRKFEFSNPEEVVASITPVDMPYSLHNNYDVYGEAGAKMLAKFKPGAVELFGPKDSPRWRPFEGVRVETAVGNGVNGKSAVAMCIGFGKCCNYPEIKTECMTNINQARPQNVVDISKHYCPMTPYMKYPDKVDMVIYGLKLAGGVINHATDIIPVVAEVKGIANAIKAGVSTLTGFDIWIPIQKFFNCLATTELSARMHKQLIRATLGLLRDDKTPRPGDLINYYYLLGLAHIGDQAKGIKPMSMSFSCRIVYALRFGFLPGVFRQIKGDKVAQWVFDGSNLSKLINFVVEGMNQLLGPLATVFTAIMNEMGKQSTGGIIGDSSGPSNDFAKTGLAMYFKDMRKKINNVLQGMTGNQAKWQELGQIFVHDAEMGWTDIADYFIEDVIAPILFNSIFWYCDKQRDPALMDGETPPQFFDPRGVPLIFKNEIQKMHKNAECNGKEKFTHGTCYGSHLQKATGSANVMIACDPARGQTVCFNHRCVCADGFHTTDYETCIPCGAAPGAAALKAAGKAKKAEEAVAEIINVEDQVAEIEEVPLAEIPSELSAEEWASLSYDEVWAQMKKEVDDYSKSQNEKSS